MDRQSLFFLVILIAGALARLSVLALRAGDLSTDPDAYLAHAEALHEGHGFASPATGKPTAFRPPGLPLLIALTPGSSEFPERSVAMINFAAGILTILLTRQLAEQLGLSSPAALTAAAMTAADPLLLRYTALPMTEVLSALLLTAALLLFVRYRQFGATQLRLGCPPESSPGETADGCRRTVNAADVSGIISAVGLITGRPLPSPRGTHAHVWRDGAAAGLLLGLAALVRPVALVVAALLIGWLVLQRLRLLLPGATCLSRFSLRHRVGMFLTLTAIPGLTLLLTISPWIVRNALQFHHLIPATTHGGYTLALGNNPEYYRDVVNRGGSRVWDGVALANWQEQMQQAAADAGIPAGDEVATDAWMYRQTRAAITGDLGSFLRASVGRISSFWALTPAAETGVPDTLVTCIGTWYLLIWVGVAAAVFRAVTGPDRICLAELWLAIVGFMVVHSFYWTDARMRTPLMPVLYLLSCIGGVTVCRAVRQLARARGPAGSVVCREGGRFRETSQTQEGHSEQAP